MVTVACVYWKGSFRGRKYSEEWVIRLKRMVSHSLNMEHRFICLSNVKKIGGIEIIPLKHDWDGWWSKIELFRKDLPGDRFLHLDLAMLPIKDLDDLINAEGSAYFMAPNLLSSYRHHPPRSGRKKLSRVKRKMTREQKIVRKQIKERQFCNGVMVWDHGYLNIFYETFKSDNLQDLENKASQKWMEDILVKNNIPFKVFPENWVKSVRNVHPDPRQLPIDCKVLSCSPGGWKPDLIVDYKGSHYWWVEETWKRGELVC